MIIRKIRKEELNERNIIASVCFELPYTPKSCEEIVDEYKASSRRVDYDWTDRWCAFLDDDKTMISSICAIPYNVYFDGNIVKMSAIGGVVTLPQYRRKGAIRECFKHAFSEMHERGIALSYLYPFSTAYYNKFGYEPVLKMVTWTMPITSIKQVDIGGSVKFYRAGDDISDLKEIYNKAMSSCNYAAVRESLDWKPVTKTFNLDDGAYYTYSFTSECGTPKSFITFRKTFDENERSIMTCRNFFCADFEGLTGILQFVRAFEAKYDAIQFKVPESFRPEKAFTEFTVNYNYMSAAFHGMARVIDAEEILRTAHYRSDGEATIILSDKYCQWNNGAYKIKFCNGVISSLIKSEESEKADASMEIDTFTALISGRYEIDDFDYIPGLDITGNKDELSKIFYRKKRFILESF